MVMHISDIVTDSHSVVYQETDFCIHYQEEQYLSCIPTVSMKPYFIYGIPTAVA
jgi:hypothetical protein